MSNQDLARQWFRRVWNDKDVNAILELMHPYASGEAEGGAILGRDQYIAESFHPLVAAFPDMHVEVDGIIGEDDSVVVRWRAEATHTGPLLALPISGRRVTFSGMTWLRFREDQIVEGWDRWNLHALLNLLGTGVESFTVRSIPPRSGASASPRAGSI